MNSWQVIAIATNPGTSSAIAILNCEYAYTLGTQPPLAEIADGGQVSRNF